MWEIHDDKKEILTEKFPTYEDRPHFVEILRVLEYFYNVSSYQNLMKSIDPNLYFSNDLVRFSRKSLDANYKIEGLAYKRLNGGRPLSDYEIPIDLPVRGICKFELGYSICTSINEHLKKWTNSRMLNWREKVRSISEFEYDI